MLGPWGKHSHRKKAAERVVTALSEGRDPRALLEALPTADRADVATRALTDLLFEDAHELAGRLADSALALGFTFAHELAHLVYFHITDALRDRVLELYQRAQQTPHYAGNYQLSNEHELFAISYQDYVRARYDMPACRLADEGGLQADTFAFFDALR